jgi:hypothetical protein
MSFSFLLIFSFLTGEMLLPFFGGAFRSSSASSSSCANLRLLVLLEGRLLPFFGGD